MTALPPSLAERVAKIVARLNPDQPGEAVAVASVLRSTLAGAGRDLLDLAEHIKGGAVMAPPPLLRRPTLTAWEIGFVANMKRRAASGSRISPRQHAKLAEIARRTGRAA